MKLPWKSLRGVILARKKTGGKMNQIMRSAIIVGTRYANSLIATWFDNVVGNNAINYVDNMKNCQLIFKGEYNEAISILLLGHFLFYHGSGFNWSGFRVIQYGLGW